MTIGNGRLLSSAGVTIRIISLTLATVTNQSMATLTKSKSLPVDDQLISLSTSIPAPFSSTDRAYILRASQSALPPHPITPTSLAPDLPPRTQEAPVFRETVPYVDGELLNPSQDQDVMPSITRVQLSVLTTLNDLLLSPFSSFAQQRSAILDHAHSDLAQPSSSSLTASFSSSGPTAALHGLIANLRNSGLNTEMIQVAPPNDDMALLPELSRYVDALAPSLQARDVQLAHALVSLLADLNRLSTLGASSPSAFKSAATGAHDTSASSIGNLDVLARQLSEFQSQHQDHSDSETPLPPVVAVERALLWARVDENLEAVLNLCRQREEDRPRLSPLDPPQYDLLSHDTELPPDYDPDQETFMSDAKSLASFSGRMSTDEKMRLDLDAVTMAIDRLYRVAPQLHNQRVELKSSKLKELESARTAQAEPTSPGKQKERELERIVDMIGRASERKIVDQTVTLEDMKARIERVRQRDDQKRQEFVDKLAEHSGARRMRAQDAAFSSKDPDALLTLPEFIRESVPHTLQPSPNPNALLTLNEAARERPALSLTPGPPFVRSKSPKGLRNRSMSAPSLSWLLPAGSKAHCAESAPRSGKGTSSRRPSTAGKTPSQLDVSYVAEHHETLRHVLIFLNVSGITPGVNLDASVINGSNDTPNGLESALVIRSGTVESPALPLPARTKPGTEEVRVQGLHYEVKVATLDPSSPKPEPLPLLDAEQLRARSPTSFICASCSLPLVHGARITRYDDLPSEHWAELVDAWMCHTDQTLNAQ
ncbi:HECT-like ubiquitin-conjugating enzyme-binding-domain-containing protein, partial [Lactifluus subvellereus]